MLLSKLSKRLKYIYKLPGMLHKQRELIQAELISSQRKWLEVLNAFTPRHQPGRHEGGHG